VPKTLIFAKTDSHADDIINTVREEFGEGNAFCKKVTYRAARDKTLPDGSTQQGEDPKSILAQFRNEYHPRIAVTVDMIATGTDVKPLECLLFMRDVKQPQLFRANERPRHPHAGHGRPEKRSRPPPPAPRPTTSLSTPSASPNR
jgi:type I restriction enzyme R subunit